MSAWMLENQRELTRQRRRRPNTGTIIHLPFEGSDHAALDNAEPPAELHLEATGPSGETAIWLDDFFWLKLIQQWPQSPLTIHFHPTNNSLLHPVILHQLNMLRRVAPQWRLVGYCYVSDLALEGRLSQAASTVHHEIHVIDAVRPGVPRPAHAMRIEDALAKMRQVQAANNRTTPIVVRCRPKLQAEPDEPQPPAKRPRPEQPIGATA